MSPPRAAVPDHDGLAVWGSGGLSPSAALLGLGWRLAGGDARTPHRDPQRPQAGASRARRPWALLIADGACALIADHSHAVSLSLARAATGCRRRWPREG